LNAANKNVKKKGMAAPSKGYETTLPPVIHEKVLQIFSKMDSDGSKTIDKEETMKFW